jgi:Tol biopolymer transport system component
MRRLLASASIVLAVAGATASAGHTKPSPRGWWIVLGSDRDGSSRAYSVRPDGARLSPILSGAEAPSPLAVSDDGGTIAYTGSFGLYVSRPDGTRLRRIARSVYVSPEQTPALSGDGKLVAFGRLGARGLWVARTDGRGLRRVARGGFYPDWSPDGKALVLTSDTSLVVQPVHGRSRVLAHGATFELRWPKWSPSGRWIAYVDSTTKPGEQGLWIVRSNGARRHRVARDTPSTFAWSPDGSSLAFGRATGAAVVGVGGGRARALRLGFAASVAAWSPDGRRLVLTGHSADDPDQVWIVGRDGRGLRRLTSAGRNTVLGWTKIAPRLPQVRPAPPTERVAGAQAVAVRAPIGELSADGGRVAFVPRATRTDCDHVSVWTPAERSLVRLGARLPAPCENLGTVNYAIYDVELAGTQVGWADVEGCGNFCDVGLETATLAQPASRTVAEAGGGGGAGGGDFWDFNLRGHGGLLVFNGVYPAPAVVRIGSGRPTTLRHGAHSAFVESVSANRIAIREADAVTVLDDQGRVLRIFPFGRGEVGAARLDGDRLVVTRGNVLEAYDVVTGAGVLQRPLPSGYALEDVDGGIAVLQQGASVLLLRLADGRSFTLAPGHAPVLAELEPPGLYYSYATAGGGGRLVFMPRAEVERRLGASVRRTAIARSGGYRILLTSNRDGRVRGYSIRPDGSRLTPLVRRGGALVATAVSRDGSTVAYESRSGIYVSRADGSGLHRVVGKGGNVALSADGRLLAFSSRGPGLWIVGADGHGARPLKGRKARKGTDDYAPVWSPDGRSIAFRRESNDASDALVVRPLHGRERVVAKADGGFDAGPQWSPNGRWIAYLDSYLDSSTPRTLWLVRPNGTGRRLLATDAIVFAWSPDGRSLAVVSTPYDGETIALVGLGGVVKRFRVDDFSVSDVAWLPDGRLALARSDGQIWIVGRDGRGLRRLTREGSNGLLGWTRLAPVRSPAAPLPKTERVVDGRTLTLRAPVASLAADGARVAFTTGSTATDCAHVAVWTPAARTIARPLPAPCGHPQDVLDRVALAGARVVWRTETCCGHTHDEWVDAARLPRLDRPSTLVASATLSSDAADGTWAGDPVGDGTLLAFTVQLYCDSNAEADSNRCPPGYESGDVSSTTLWRLGGHGHCPGNSEIGFADDECTLVLKADGKLDLLAVDAGRLVVGTKSGVEIVSASGRVLRDVATTAKAAALSGDRLAVQTATGVDVYDTRSGRRVIQLSGARGLQDLESGILVTASGGTVTIRRLADGRTVTMEVAGKARAQLEAPGLFVAGRDRITFTPMRELFP